MGLEISEADMDCLDTLMDTRADFDEDIAARMNRAEELGVNPELIRTFMHLGFWMTVNAVAHADDRGRANEAWRNLTGVILAAQDERREKRVFVCFCPGCECEHTRRLHVDNDHMYQGDRPVLYCTGCVAVKGQVAESLIATMKRAADEEISRCER